MKNNRTKRIKLTSEDLHTSLHRKSLLSKNAYYVPGFKTEIAPATNKDIDNSHIYAVQLVQSYHGLILPIQLLDRSETSDLTSHTTTYYATLGKIILGILEISIKKYTKKYQEIVYTYKYKTDAKNYEHVNNIAPIFSNLEKDGSLTTRKKKALSFMKNSKGLGKHY
ncbi:MAG: hypothetical protein [Caudoviricetes sp.]|nr:MAG: hypothetical protein [Caudoviricetes sp.]